MSASKEAFQITSVLAELIEILFAPNFLIREGNDTRIEEQFNQMAKNLINATNSIESFYADNKNYNTTRMKTILSCRNGSLSVNNACGKHFVSPPPT